MKNTHTPFLHFFGFNFIVLHWKKKTKKNPLLLSSWVINCKFNCWSRSIPTESAVWTVRCNNATVSQVSAVEKCSHTQVPGPVILTYSFWLRQRGCIKGIAKSWVFVKWRWMGWFGLKVIFYLGSDVLFGNAAATLAATWQPREMDID